MAFTYELSSKFKTKLNKSGAVAGDADAPQSEKYISIKFKVKGGVITWLFGTPKDEDETCQEFRDILYATAADAHEQVEFGCDKYYRGSDTYHIKKMHSCAYEVNFNHNHYRMTHGKDITPKEVSEHLRAFLAHPNGKLFFPDHKEVDYIIRIFGEYWYGWTTTKGREISLKDQYESERSETLDILDIKEEQAGIHVQDPCHFDHANRTDHELANMKNMRLRGLMSDIFHLPPTVNTDTHEIPAKRF